MLLLKSKKDDTLTLDLRKSSPEEIRFVAEIFFAAAQTVSLASDPLVMTVKKNSSDFHIRS